MSKWSGASYQGPVDNDWEQGLGKHKFPNGVIYDGLLDKGEFHGEGTLIYPNGVSCFFFYFEIGTLRCKVGQRKTY